MTSAMELVKERKRPAESGAAEPRRVCFICTGNTCRSPMAEAVANALILSEGRTDLRAFSAGIDACEGAPITENAVRALEEAEIPAVVGHDYHRHVAHGLSEEDAGFFDLFVCMTREHAMQMMLRFPEAIDKITVMPVQIPDPYSGSLAVYRACLEEIRKGVRALFPPREKA